MFPEVKLVKSAGAFAAHFLPAPNPIFRGRNLTVNFQFPPQTPHASQKWFLNLGKETASEIDPYFHPGRTLSACIYQRPPEIRGRRTYPGSFFDPELDHIHCQPTNNEPWDSFSLIDTLSHELTHALPPVKMVAFANNLNPRLHVQHTFHGLLQKVELFEKDISYQPIIAGRVLNEQATCLAQQKIFGEVLERRAPLAALAELHPGLTAIQEKLGTSQFISAWFNSDTRSLESRVQPASFLDFSLTMDKKFGNRFLLPDLNP